jgi:hypothetical protein
MNWDATGAIGETDYVLEGWTISLYGDPNEPNNGYFVNLY